MSDSVRLSDLGERRIVEEILRPRYAVGEGAFGDDCAHLTLEAGTVVMTTDPCPKPMAHILGFTDEYFRGWLLGTINLSDIAAAGARPRGMLTSFVLPAEMPLTDFTRLLDGVDACCVAADTRVVGGNLKEGLMIDVQATAFGSVIGRPLGRRGAEVGDAVFAAGPTGSFWAGVSAIRAGRDPMALAPGLLKTVRTPSAQLAFGQALQRSGIRCAVMDNSDGLGSSLNTLAATNGIQILMDLDMIELDPCVSAVAIDLGIDQARFALGWGDWNLVVVVDGNDTAELAEIAMASETQLVQVATTREGSGVRAARGGRELDLAAPDSERFASESWFSVGIERYIEQLLTFPLP